MIEMIDIGVENAVAYRLKGKITEDEMKSVISIFKEKINNDEKLIIYQEIVNLGGLEIDALVEKLKFFVDVGLSHFDKIAVITHKKWIHKLVDLEGKFFKNIDMKGFSTDEKEKAIDFLKNE